MPLTPACRIFVTGTDTGVGKSLLSLLLMIRLYDLDKKPFYFKPFQTGVLSSGDENSDARMVYDHIPQLLDESPERSIGYCFRAPKAPLFAAREEERSIDVQKIHDRLREIETHADVVVLEGAGGLMVPITSTFGMTDLIRETASLPVVAARAGLGTINHTLLSIEYLRSQHMTVGGLILIDSALDPTDPLMIEENIEAIELKSGIRAEGFIPKLKDFSRSSLQPFFPMIDALIKRITC